MATPSELALIAVPAGNIPEFQVAAPLLKWGREVWMASTAAWAPAGKHMEENVLKCAAAQAARIAETASDSQQTARAHCDVIAAFA